MSLEAVLQGKRIVVCAGAGGVGKTTCAAAIGMAAAGRGMRVLVMTIDPARRLAGALGLPDIGDEPHRVDLTGRGMPAAGRLDALMLDAKGTFDRLVREHAPTTERAERILRNPIYRQVSGAVAGSQEYMAMERLWELHAEGGYDLIVLDTPPARNALDFLDAPGRVMRFIEGRALRLLLRPGLRAGRLGLRVLGSGTQVMMSAVERLTGLTLLEDVSEFLGAFDGMYEGFRDRAERVGELLASERTTFVLITSAEPEPIGEAEAFWQALVEHGMPFGGAVVNKVHPDHLQGRGRRGVRSRAQRQLVDAGVPEAVATRAAANLDGLQALASRDRTAIERLERLIAPQPLLCVPRLDHDVDDLDAVSAVSRHLER
ncbi:MAG TPA: ArsA-related P-loop ATPase [Gaiellales bacterium]|nr:ArsA-related P-loop ATPase [Gaiellales bacterium]